MRRVGRYLLNALATISLVACTATAVAWVRSQWKSDGLQWNWTDQRANRWRGFDVTFGRSCVYLSDQTFIFERPGKVLEYTQKLQRTVSFVHKSGERWSMPYQYTFWNRLSFGLFVFPWRDDMEGDSRGRFPYRSKWTVVYVPYWFLVPLFACGTWPLARCAHARWLRARRLKQQQCPFCGYDLRASSGACPECGGVEKRE